MSQYLMDLWEPQIATIVVLSSLFAISFIAILMDEKTILFVIIESYHRPLVGVGYWNGDSHHYTLYHH